MRSQVLAAQFPIANVRVVCQLLSMINDAKSEDGESMFEITSIEDLWDQIAYVLLYAPDLFPYEDFLATDEQMTLDRAFQQLHGGVVIAYPENSFDDRRHELHGILDRSFLAYRNGQEAEGATLLNDFEGRIFKH